MSSVKSEGSVRVAVVGPVGASSPPPANCPVEVLQRSTSRGFGGGFLQHLLLNVDWSTVVQSISLNIVSSWLYDQFKGPAAIASADPLVAAPESAAPPIALTITVNNHEMNVVVTSPETLAEALKQALPPTQPE